MTPNPNSPASMGDKAREHTLFPLIHAYGRACRRDGNPAWESDEGQALLVALASLPQEPASQEAERLIAANPYTSYSYVAQNADVERQRAEKYARTLLRTALTASLSRAVQAAPEPARAEAGPAGWKLLKDSTHEERSWSEDAGHENGRYSCSCAHCLRMFVGHKRRVFCRVCSNHPPKDQA
jgi:hypothetical protein